MSQDLYRHYNEEGQLLYVGVSLSAIARLGQHKQASHWYNQITNVKIEKFETREQVLEAELKAIAEENPIHNLRRPTTKEDIADANLAFFDDSPPRTLSKLDILRRTVQMKPMYSPTEAGSFLGIGPKAIQEALKRKELGFVLVGTKLNIVRITGWQLIDFIENLEVKKSKLPPKRASGGNRHLRVVTS